MGNVNFIHYDLPQGDVFTVYSEAYKITLAISQLGVTESCMGTGIYKNDYNDREVLVSISFKQGSNTYTVHYPAEDNDGIDIEMANVTSCTGNKISGTFSATLDSNGITSINGEPIPEIIEITEGQFNLTFTEY